MVNMMAPGTAERFRETISAAYRRRFGITPAFCLCIPSRGAEEL
jgi:galactokinase